LKTFQAICIRLDLAFKNRIIGLLKILLYGNVDKFLPRRILIFRTGFIGDTVCALPAMFAIKNNFPTSEIVLLTKADGKNASSFEQIVRSAGFDNVINYYGLTTAKLFSILTKGKYDLFIELTQYDTGFWYQLRNTIFIRTLGIKKAFGWKVNSSRLFQKYQEEHIGFENERERLLSLLKDNGLKIENEQLKISVPDTVKGKIQELMQNKELLSAKKNIGIVIGSKRERNKWPITYFKEVVEYYAARSYNILILGNDEDKVQVQKLLVEKNVFDFCGSLTTIETAELISHCALIITNDTGPMHLAYTMGTPLVSIFSSRDFPNKWYPPVSRNNIVLRPDNILCSICFTRECFDNVCMKKIKPMTVISKADNILQANNN
jgi:ADP-heptose:LPS heptosyltransferase